MLLLQVANIGDSGFRVIRNGHCVHASQVSADNILQWPGLTHLGKAVLLALRDVLLVFTQGDKLQCHGISSTGRWPSTSW